MGLQRKLENHGQPNQQAEEEDDREQMSHSFSPDLSTAERSEAPFRSLGPGPCSSFVRLSSGQSPDFGGLPRNMTGRRAATADATA
jgi:hypothetical protein